jgi:hypothetical protein
VIAAVCRRSIRNPCFSAVSLMLGFLVALANAAETQSLQSAVAERWLAAAVAQRLHQDPQWLALLHYVNGNSLVDSPAFFLDSRGAHDPEAELRATIRGLFTPSPTAESAVVELYPARTMFLVRALGPTPDVLPRLRSTRFEAAMATLRPQSVDLVFPTPSFAGAASMFGHTILVVRSAPDAGQAPQAIDFLAHVPEGVFWSYVPRGIFGGFVGRFSSIPFWSLQRQYVQIEQRDLWAYHLNLTPDEIRMLLANYWELRDMGSCYRFFSANCSHGHMRMLAAARPQAGLPARLEHWTIPLQVIRAARDAGMIDGVEVELSPATMWHSAHALHSRRAAETSTSLLKDAPAAAALRDLEHQEQLGAVKMTQAVLVAAAARGVIDEAFLHKRVVDMREALGAGALPAPDPSASPDRAHEPFRMGLGGGISAGASFISVSIRPAYHGLDDPGEGTPIGSDLRFLDGEVRWYPDAEGRARLRLHRLDLVGIAALSPAAGPFGLVSWMAQGGIDTDLVTSPEMGRTHGFLRLGLGFAEDPWLDTRAYALVQAEGRVTDRAAIGSGGETGLLVRYGTLLTLHPYVRGLAFVGSIQGSIVRTGACATIAMNGALAVTLDAVHEEAWGSSSNEASLTLHAYW